jgi:Ni,Fe-hydrogenase III small subunit
LHFSPAWVPAAARREDCRTWTPPPAAHKGAGGGSLQVRVVDAGSCNACEQELAALSGPAYDFQRFGLDIVASPRHADVLLVTGPLTRAMGEAFARTWDAVPAPKLVLAAGACAISGGLFRSSYATRDGVATGNHGRVVWLPGCPPRPQAFFEALLACREKLREA